jgi:hypothetical protein
MVKKNASRAAGQQAVHDIQFRDEYQDELINQVAAYEKHVRSLKGVKKRQKESLLQSAQKHPVEDVDMYGCEDDEQDIYTVEKIVDKKRVNQKTLYLVKWEGYSSDQNTWEPV